MTVLCGSCLRVRTVLVGALLAAGVLTACGGNMQPAITTFVPSATFTSLPLPTTVAAIPSPGPGVVFVTSTPLPAATATPGPSPTSPLAATIPPPPVTMTITTIPTLAGLRVEYFTTDSEAARPGDNVTLYWSVRGADQTRIYRVAADDERVWRWDVNASGQITVSTGTTDRDVARFLLEAESGGATIEQPLLIPLECPEIWYFDPAPDACPAAPPQITIEAEQTFEHGRMLWVEAQDRIYVMFDDGLSPTWAQYPDDFNEGDQERDDSLSEPPGLLQPIRGFGLVWRSNPRVRDRLGWANSPEVSFEGMLQADSLEGSVATTYLRMRDGGIMALDAFNDTWEVLPPVGGTAP